MPEKVWTKEEVERAVGELEAIDTSPEDIDDFLVGIKAKQPSGMFIWEKPAAEQGRTVTNQIARFAGPYLGGVYGAQAVAGRNALPFLGGTGRAITQFGGEAAGIGLGDVASRAATGEPQDLMESGKTGLGGAAIGGLFRAGSRLASSGGNIPEAATMGLAEPMKAGDIPLIGKRLPGKLQRTSLPVPNLKRMSKAGPHTIAEVKGGISPEVTLADRAALASRRLSGTITEARMAKEAIIKQATAQGTKLPAQPIFDALADSQISADVAISAEAQAYNSAVEQTADELGKLAMKQGGTLQPTQVDEMIRRVLRPKVYTASGNVRDTMLAEAYGNAEKVATEALTKHLPGDLAAKNAEIAQRLTAMENAEKMFGDPDKAGVINRLRSAFNAGNEQTAQALGTLAQHDAALVDDAFDLYTRRQMAGDIRQPPLEGPAVNRSGVLRNIGGRVGRATAPFQRFVGGTAAGIYAAKRKNGKRRPTAMESP